MGAHDGPDEAYPDAWIAAEAIETLQNLAEEKEPWFLALDFSSLICHLLHRSDGMTFTLTTYPL